MNTLLHTKSKYLIIIIISLLFCAATIIFETGILRQNQESFSISFGKEQELLVSQIERQFINALSLQANNEQTVIKDIINNSITSSNRYWFFIKENKILFFKDDNETNQLMIKDINMLLKSFEMNGGKNIDPLIALFSDRAKGSVLFSESAIGENKLASVSFFEVNGTSYALGICTTEAYIIDSGYIFKHNSYSIITIVALCLILFSIVVVAIIIIDKKDNEIQLLKKLIKSKNQIIEELTTANVSELDLDLLYNKDTNIYNEKVFAALLNKLENPQLFPISKIVINMSFPENITFDGLVSELLPVLKKLLPQKGILAKTQDNELTVLLFRTDYNSAMTLQSKLMNAWSNILKKFNSSVNTNVILLYEKADSIFPSCAEENKTIAKKNQIS
ncbi:hypothetical protein EHE19_019400 [Ruminiclostridium herbifermentans]|uniref:Uncharacterized protein n=1 Tax=Ruminiclostridium herbifermentans TaxID=2488810 RepID=A0A4U7JAW6_9FIRM|nr:hypothetical protein [Ruminiclostridium herbifermentans]QNU66961.1 hypothetical protein EHE19_019400 [Ruminiclostridium herbifermentans]